MKKILVIFYLFMSITIFSKPSDPLGVYYNNVQAKYDACLQVLKEKDGTYSIKVIKLIHNPDRLDIYNPNKELRNKKVLNLVIGKGFVYDKIKDKYINGLIYNYETGNTYYASFYIEDNGNLLFRGSIDPLQVFGMNVTFEKIK